MYELPNFVQGPFKDEADFKAAVLEMWRKKFPKITRFEIENEEKEPGMPDCLSIMPGCRCFFTEFKVSSGNGVITFEKTQPHFYALHQKLPISIIAWDSQYNRAVQIDTVEILAAKSLKFQIPKEL